MDVDAAILIMTGAIPANKRRKFGSPTFEDNYFDNVIAGIQGIKVTKNDQEVAKAHEIVVQSPLNIPKEGPYIGDRVQSKEYQDPSDDEETEVHIEQQVYLDDVEDELNGDYQEEGDDDLDVDEDTADVKLVLGQRLTRLIEQSTGVEPVHPPDSLATSPRPDQLYTAARLLFLTASIFKGGILGDPVGLGKTLSVITLILSKRRSPSEAPPLVITKKAVVSHWVEELRRHIKPEHHLKVLILNKPVKNSVLQLTTSLC